MILAFIFTFQVSGSADVLSWRNGGNGVYSSTAPTSQLDQHILWETPLDETSNASPIVVGDKIFICEEPHTLICLDKNTGIVLWRRGNDPLDFLELSEEEKLRALNLQEKDDKLLKELQQAQRERYQLSRRARNDADNEALEQQIEEKEKVIDHIENRRTELAADPTAGTVVIQTHPTNGYTSFTPVSDGKNVYAAFGQGVLVAYDFQGNKIWGRKMERPNDALGEYQWGGSTSPILAGDILIIRFADYTALDKKTGQELWRIPSEVFYGTPRLFGVEDEHFYFTTRGEVIRVSDGHILQSGLVDLHDEHPWATFNSPVIEDGVLYCVRGKGYDGADGHSYAFRIPETIEEMNSSGLTELWHTEVHKQRYYASPIVHNGLMYVLSQDLVLTVLGTETGKVIYEHKLTGVKGVAYPSLSVAGGKIYLGSDDGTLVTLKPGREFEQISSSRFDTFRSTPVYDNDRLYLRTYSSLLAIGIVSGQ